MRLTNEQIYKNCEQLLKSFNDNTKYFPGKITFIIQRNKKTLLDICKTIDEVRASIAANYGEPDPENPGSYIIPAETRALAQIELNDLSAAAQEVNIIMLDYKDIENVEFTPNQMDAILFMINEQAE